MRHVFWRAKFQKKVPQGLVQQREILLFYTFRWWRRDTPFNPFSKFTMEIKLDDVTINFQDLDLEDLFSAWQWRIGDQKGLDRKSVV